MDLLWGVWVSEASNKPKRNRASGFSDRGNKPGFGLVLLF